MNDKTSNDLYGKIKHCNEFINHSNDSNLSSSHDVDESSTKQKHIKNKTTIDHNDDLFKHVKDILRKQGQFKKKAIVFNIMGCLTASEYYKHYSFYYIKIY